MPTYGYRCPSCSQEFEVWQKMSDPPGAACPACATQAKRIFYPAGIVFKGSGFYATDSRTSSTATSPAASNGSSTSTSGDGAKSSESTTKKSSESPTTTSTASSGAADTAS